MRRERETDVSSGEEEEANQARGARVVFGETRFPDLIHFTDERDDLDSYLLRFERYAPVANRPQPNWATQLSALLRGKALDISSRLSQEDALNYGCLKMALLQPYDYTKQGYRQCFREAKPEFSKNPRQFIVRFRNYFILWMKLSDVESTFDGVVDLMVK